MSIDREVLRQNIISRRTFLLATGQVGVLSLLLSRMFFMQLVRGNDYKILSDKNRISLVMMPPDRGLLVDRNNVTIAETRPSFLLKLDRKQTKDYQESLDKLFAIIASSEDEKKDIFSRLKKSNRRIPVTILDDIKWDKVARIEEQLNNIAGIYVEEINIRKYDYPESCCHVTGYVGKISSEELEELDDVTKDFEVGKSGVEKQYEESLQGQFGYKKVEVNAYGNYVNQIEKQESVQGSVLPLNIDVKLQDYVYSLLDDKGCSVVVMDPFNGAIKCLCSKPGYNPNDFVGGISHNKWKSLINDPYKPLINKVVQTQYPPGSTFKLMTILAALEAGISPDQVFTCQGHVMLGDRAFHCWYHSGHGALNLIDAIKHSCNCYMFNIGKTIGVDKILDTARRFGYGSHTNIDLPGEAKGFVPDRQWRLKNFKFDWTLGDVFNLSIGQGALLSTPMQQAVMISAFANGKNLIKPRLAQSSETNGTLIEIKQEYLDIIREGMFRVVNEQGGTASRSKTSKVTLIGKTGTSQVQAKKNAADDLSAVSVKWERRNHALFAGYVPYDNPEIIISIIYDHGGGGGGSAAPIAKKIVEFLYGV